MKPFLNQLLRPAPTAIDEGDRPFQNEKVFFGFQTGDVVRAMVPKGKYRGTWYGAVACRKNGYFDIKNKEGKRIAQGISHKYCKMLNRMDGYEYSMECLKVDGIPLMTEVKSILPDLS